jgi:Na+-translocating ferredoxin:NAD+ oxidoreductase subunit C
MLLRKIKGVHLDGRKDMSTQEPIETYLNPEFIYIPLLAQATPCKALVQVGDKVLMGQPVAKRDDRFAHNLHSSVSGEVTGIKKMWHSSGKMLEMLEIKNDFQDKLDPAIRLNNDLDQLTQSVIVERVKNAGVVGLGGSGFPTYAKLTPTVPIHAVLINAAECEPYLTADYMLIKSETDRLMRGLKYTMKAVSAERGIIAIKKTKPAAIAALEAVIANYPGISIHQLNDEYPAGWEKYIVERVLGKTYDRLPSEAGAIVNNVATAIAICDAVEQNMPLIHKVVTVTGEGVAKPHNFLVKVGTKVNELIEKAGGYRDVDADMYFIAGGPMTGTALIFDEVIVNNSLGSIIVKERQEILVNPACVGCGQCSDVCPVFLNPIEIKQTFDSKDIAYLIELNATKCISCGLCSYICPSRIELSDATTRAKALAMKG